jgi:hypothetical protein
VLEKTFLEEKLDIERLFAVFETIRGNMSQILYSLSKLEDKF